MFLRALQVGGGLPQMLPLSMPQVKMISSETNAAVTPLAFTVTLIAAAIILRQEKQSRDKQLGWVEPDWEAEAQRASRMVAVTGEELPNYHFAVRSAPGSKGFGLFATDNIEMGTFLMEYTGVTMAYDNYDGSSDYALSTYNAAGIHFIIDASDKSRAGLARYMNHQERNPPCECVRGAYNLADRKNEAAPPTPLFIFARRHVRAGEELCWDYGAAFWDGRQDLARRKESLAALVALAAEQSKDGSH